MEEEGELMLLQLVSQNSEKAMEIAAAAVEKAAEAAADTVATESH